MRIAEIGALQGLYFSIVFMTRTVACKYKPYVFVTILLRDKGGYGGRSDKQKGDFCLFLI